MTATVTRIHEHVCTYRLWSVDRWVCVSECHRGQTIQAEAPAPKRGVA